MKKSKDFFLQQKFAGKIFILAFFIDSLFCYRMKILKITTDKQQRGHKSVLLVPESESVKPSIISFF